MTPDEFKLAAKDWAKIVTVDEKTNWSGGLVAAWEYASVAQRRTASHLASRATGGPFGRNNFDDGKTLLLVMPTEEMASRARQAIGEPKFSASLAQPC
jgi:hypothetical protein